MTLGTSQVPLDRVTQAIYARIYAAMKPFREKLAVHASGSMLADEFDRFHEFLPEVETPAYQLMRTRLADAATSLRAAGGATLASPTRALATQIISHDLARVAAIAVKLNEDDAPKFFAAIQRTDSPFESVAAVATAKTRISKADFDAAIQQIVQVRLEEFIHHVKKDAAKWLSEPVRHTLPKGGRRRTRSALAPTRPTVTFSDGFKTVNCTAWARSESRQRQREATNILRALYENWLRGNRHIPTTTLLKGGASERIEKALNKAKYPQTFSLLDIRLNNRTGRRTIRLSGEYDYDVR